MRGCKQCEDDISLKHPNAKFCNSKCKDRFHNSKPHRLERSKMFAKPKVKTVKVYKKESNLSRLLDQKLNDPFRDMSEFGDKD